MEYSKDNSVIMVIGLTAAAEIAFLNSCNKVFEHGEITESDGSIWSHALSDENNALVYNKPDGLREDFSFILINQFVPFNEFERLFDYLNKSGKQLIVWAHATERNNHDPVVEEEVRDQLSNVTYFYTFSHSGYHQVEVFMKSVANNRGNYSQAYNVLLSAAVERRRFDHIIALYILCKGYLAGLERLNSPEEARNWWKFIEDADLKAEIGGLKDIEARNRLEELIRDLRQELKEENMALPRIVGPLKKEIVRIEEGGGFL